MNIQHFEKGLHYTDKELLLLAKKVGRLATYCRRLKDESSIIRIEAERRQTKKDNDAVKVMVAIKLPKKVLLAESRREKVLNAVDRCIEKLKPQVEEYKELHTSRGRAAVQARKARTRRRAE